MSEISKYFPNIPVTHWVNLRTQFKKSIPGTISSNYLASILDMSEASAKANIIPSLRQIGLIDSEGKTNQELAKKLRDDDLYVKFCQETLTRIYPQELRDAFPDKDSNRDKVKKWFMNHTGVGNSAANRIVAFYLALLEADPTGQKATKSNNNSKSKETKAKPNKTANKAIDIPVEEKPTVVDKSIHPHKDSKDNSGPSLNVNIQIHISSDASPDQIKSIFENMAKYIYKS